jgi:formylglycine-generating enzyme required for sulfatase activity
MIRGDETAPAAAEGMVWIQAGSFRMGSDEFYPEEKPVRAVEVAGFWMDPHPVTVAEFARFVTATGYVTIAEREPDPADYPDADPALLHAGSLVFRRASGPLDLDDERAWWEYVRGADWSHPEGPDSDNYGRARHPVTHVAYADAQAYAAWCGRELPTEPEWEYAARGGLEGARYAWGDVAFPDGRAAANTWQGEFPWQNLRIDGYEGTSPWGAYEPNAYGLYDMIGNVWEWTCDRFASGEHDAFPRHVIKGGSHLSAQNYDLRYRPAARRGVTIDTSRSDLGFRCVVRPS